MSSRERKRAERRKRKRRNAERAAVAEEITTEAAEAENGERSSPEDLAAAAERRGVSRSELKNERVRESLEPLEEGERPAVVTIGAVISALIAAVTMGAWIAGAEVDGDRPAAGQVLAPSILFAVMAYGMWRARYWAVLGFQAVMAILMVGAFLTLISATSLLGALTPLLVLAAAGALFWFMVKALARIQMPRREF